MIRNQSIQQPSDTLPVEMVSPPIDWMSYVTPENILIGLAVLFICFILIDEQREVLKDEG